MSICKPHKHKNTAMDKETGYFLFLILEGKSSPSMCASLEERGIPQFLANRMGWDNSKTRAAT